MSYRSSFGAAYGGGRASPYAPRPGAQDRSFSDLFEYVDAGETGSRSYVENVSAVPFEDDDAPDVIHVKHMGQAFPLQFPAYSISESGVTVQEVRRRVAERLQQDQRRIRLVYKEKELKYDPSPVKKYGCKQNSEIQVVVTEQYSDYGGTDSHQSSGDDSGSGSSLKPQPDRRRPRGLSSVRYRSDDGKDTVKISDGFLHPNGYSRRESRSDGRRKSVSPARSKEPAKSTERLSSTPQPTSISRPTSASPDTPLGKVQALQDVYYDKWLPESQLFLAAPPSDAIQRDRDYRRLSESVMKHVIEAADAIELQGDQTARAERKKVLSEAQELLKKLDAVPKTKSR